MPKEINLIYRLGNKKNDIRFFMHLFPTDNTIIVEPFGGSFAVSKYMYDDNKKFHINDLDEDLFYIYSNHHNFMQMIDDIKKESLNYDLKTDSKKFVEYIKTKSYDEKLLKMWISSRVANNRSFYRVTIPKTIKYSEQEIKILNSSIITNNDYKELFKQYKDNENAFLFLDPPYMFSNNTTYLPQNKETDNTNMLVNIYEFMKTCKCKVMLVINKLAVIEYIFKEFYRLEYIRYYPFTQKKLIHSVYCNY